jgi:hypothetical protein
MLDIILFTILSPYISDVWNYITNPTVGAAVRVFIFIIGIITFALFTFYLFLRHWGMLRGEKKETSVDAFTHTNVPDFEDIIPEVKNEIYMVGITLEGINHKIPTLEKALTKNRRGKILVCDPDTPLLEEIEMIVVSTKTTDRIKGTLGMLTQMQTRLGDKSHNVEIRTHKRMPTFSMIILDPNSDDGLMFFEPYVSNTPQQYRRIFRISKRDQSNIFEVYFNAFNDLWNNGAKASNSM